MKTMKKLNSWFEIDEHQYLMYLLQGYEIVVDQDYVEWLLDGKMHREDGPAHINDSGYRTWWLNGVRHRTDGPAREWMKGTKEWWLYDIQYSEAEFNEKVKQLV